MIYKNGQYEDGDEDTDYEVGWDNTEREVECE